MQRKILIADDHSLLRRSIRSICRTEGIDQPEEAESCRELLRALQKDDYTHLILDLMLADGSSLTLLPRIFENYPKLRILIYSSQPEALHGNAVWRRFGVQYLSKGETEPQTIKRMTEFLQDLRPKAPEPDSPDKNPFINLAPREKDVLLHLLEGRSPSDIADSLDLSAATVRVLKKRILEKTKTKDVAELSNLAAIYRL